MKDDDSSAYRIYHLKCHGECVAIVNISLDRLYPVHILIWMGSQACSKLWSSSATRTAPTVISGMSHTHIILCDNKVYFVLRLQRVRFPPILFLGNKQYCRPIIFSCFVLDFLESTGSFPKELGRLNNLRSLSIRCYNLTGTDNRGTTLALLKRVQPSLVCRRMWYPAKWKHNRVCTIFRSAFVLARFTY